MDTSKWQPTTYTYSVRGDRGWRTVAVGLSASDAATQHERAEKAGNVAGVDFRITADN
jgi:hypothetical protein